ncbi:MAG: ABC transporter ATP-binding protein [Anaerolineaceae bacterium]|nr:ABC transporter ATP-binding protein [Anaerolineaceae bacterium]
MNIIETPIVEVKNLTKTYSDVQVVDNISFEIYQGEIFGLLGPNGAGKTTSIECIEGLRTADNGTIKVLGLDPQKEPYALKERIGIQFQAAALPARIKVWEALDLSASLYQKRADWKTLLDQMGLADKWNAPVNKLSGGQKQRVFIALALINDPELIFLDELTTGLDPQARRAMWNLVEEIRSKGKTIFLTTHFMEEAERLCDRIAIIDQGKIIALDTPSNLINSLEFEKRLVFEVSNSFNKKILEEIKSVSRVENSRNRIVVYGQGNQWIGSVMNTLEKECISFNNLQTEQASLEDVFLALTGKEMRG